MVTRRELVTFLDDLLRPPPELKDSSRNGLQVEGTDVLHRVAFGVDASLALFQAAAAWDAQAVVVHHGLFWHDGFSRVLGAEAVRLRLLLGAGINLYASHVPLDCHPRVGNNAVIAAGHYATEVWGLRALMAELQAAVPVQCRFIDLPTGC